MNSAGPVDRAVHVALGGEVHHGAGAVLREGGAHRLGVADVGADVDVARVRGLGAERGRAGRVGQLVDVHHHAIRGRQEVTQHRGTDEAVAAGDEQRHRVSCSGKVRVSAERYRVRSGPATRYRPG
jgi:hypothetical protein